MSELVGNPKTDFLMMRLIVCTRGYLYAKLVGCDRARYINMPMQYAAIVKGCKNDNFHKNFFSHIFLFLLKTLIVGTS